MYEDISIVHHGALLSTTPLSPPHLSLSRCHPGAMDVTTPELWADWCSVTGTPVDARDGAVLDRFRRQAHPSKQTLAALRPVEPAGRTTAWPSGLRTQKDSLAAMLRTGAAHIRTPGLHWMTRARLHRLLFLAVLVAPVSAGGLALKRHDVPALTPAALTHLRPQLGTSAIDDPGSCPSCAVWSWLAVLGANGTLSRSAVRKLLHDEGFTRTSGHRHLRPDPNTSWRAWPNHPNLVPAIDRWGWMDTQHSMHPSSLSVLLKGLGELLDAPAPEPVVLTPGPRRPARRVSAEEESEIYARADELNARVARLLEEFG